MATYTENYNLTMPEESDYYNVESFNENFEAIDTLMAENEAVSNEINEKIGTPAKTGQTLFSMLENNNDTGLTSIKSIQRVTYCNETQSADNVNVSIKAVNPANCIVLMEFLCYPQDRNISSNYVLHESAIAVTHNMAIVNSVKLGFWIIEFN